MSTLLAVESIEVGYGDVTAVADASLVVRQGETVALIGSTNAKRFLGLPEAPR